MFDISQVDMSLAPRAYCYDNDGIFTHAEAFSLDPLESEMAGEPVWLQPGMSLPVAPGDSKTGFVWRVAGDAWEEVEDHRGESGYVNGVTTEIKEYGPLPDGWSVTPPPPTADQLFAAMRASRDARLAATDKYLLVDYPISEGDLALVKAYRAALRDLPDQPGAPWDGGGTETPWPVKPE